MNILGISCHYHDSAACIVQDGEIVAAAQEERFNGGKYSPVFPLQAANYCLQAGGLTSNDLDYIAFYEKPYLKFSRVLVNHLRSYPFSLRNFIQMMPPWLEDRLIVPLVIKRELGYEGKTVFIRHHLSHAASAFMVSPFEEAALITADGIGEWASTSYGIGRGNRIAILKELHYPHSLGLLYAAVTAYLGFKVFAGEGKVMGLSSYGSPTYLDAFKKIITVQGDGSFFLDNSYFGFNRGDRMYGRKFLKLFGPARKPETALEQRHYDIAASLQRFIEDTLLALARHAHTETRMKKLCLAGGVFLNCVANQRLLEESPFEEIYIHPAAGDAGGALGAASYTYHALLGNPRNYVMEHAYLGPEYSPLEMKRALLNHHLSFNEYHNDALFPHVAQRIADGRIVGWFQGRMEWGPRALGNRSILADPRNPRMKELLNDRVKKREPFRPYAPAVLSGRAQEYFELSSPSRFMLLAPQVKRGMEAIIPGVTHVDGTARVQTVHRETNPRFHRLIESFDRITGVPVVINTSFNLRGEPIVRTPDEAISVFQRSEMDCLVIGNFVAERKPMRHVAATNPNL